MDDEKLIELIKENRFLYDPSHPKYMDPKYKVKVWQSIGNKLKISGVQCKTRWTNIRDHFRRHLLKRKKMPEYVTEFRKKYKYADRLQFLVPFTIDRHAGYNSSLQETSAHTELMDDINEAIPDEQSDTETNQSQISSSVPAKTFQGCSNVGRSQSTSSLADTPSLPPVKYIIDKDDPQNISHAASNDDIDTFLMGIASTLKRLNPYNQHVAKGQIFNIVHEMEAQEFFSQAPHGSNTSPRHSLDSDSRRSNEPS
ncbi:unnamed protein product [Nezara viridula]|uniref:MADF domain-containing protein n=1 Tax=Nezara viridula TaxID=85310 RepID=A0A9P0H6I6_NEZVI|nr:unnamed protein product [Nezara viridula]